MSKSEKAIQTDSLLLAGDTFERDIFVWRNNTGQGWQGIPVKAITGSMIRVEPGMKILRDARPITFGLPGSGDALGVIRHRDTGLGVPIAGEFKTLTGQLEVSQIRFKQRWQEVGGVFIKARSPEEFVRGLRQARGE